MWMQTADLSNNAHKFRRKLFLTLCVDKIVPAKMSVTFQSEQVKSICSSLSFTYRKFDTQRLLRDILFHWNYRRNREKKIVSIWKSDSVRTLCTQMNDMYEIR